MTFTCPIVAQSHYQGKVHAKNLRMKSVDFKIPGQCGISKFIQCSLDEFGRVVQYELFVPWTVTSQKPSSPAALPKKMSAEDPGSIMETGDSEGTNSTRFCSICQASFNNPLMAQQHYVGKRHRKQLTKQKLMETYGPSSAPGPNTATNSIHILVNKKVHKGLKCVPSVLADSFHTEGLPVHCLQDWTELRGTVPVSHQRRET